LLSKRELQQQLEVARCHLHDIETDRQASMSISEVEDTFGLSGSWLLFVVVKGTYFSMKVVSKSQTAHLVPSTRFKMASSEPDRGWLLSVVA